MSLELLCLTMRFPFSFRPPPSPAPRFRPKEFLEDEAELSGDEMEKANFADEAGEGDDDDNSDAGSLKEFVDETDDINDRGGKLRREVERVYNRIQADEDQRELRYLKVSSSNNTNTLFYSLQRLFPLT